ncbi:MAG TPA: GNAT family N-acetyltransferase [Candidatus Baltobacteraceae bacterium]|nr:GNAT family N-acetyltransferase [Candidatus Baltobacteraceae bacterium]
MNAPAIIRPVHADDAPQLADVFIDSIRGLAPRSYTPAQVTAWASAALDLRDWRARLSNHLAFVAERDGRLLGWIEVEGTMRLDRFYCRTEAAGTGVAAALYGTLELHQRTNGVLQMQTEASALLRPFLERRGWHVDAEETIERLGVSLTRYRMSKWLTDSSGKYLRSFCERCFRALLPGAPAFCCTHRCTFCKSCTNEMDGICPNCGGRLDAAE